MVKQYMDYLSTAIVVFLFLPLCNNNIPGISYLIILWNVSFVCLYSKGLFDKNMLRVLFLGLFIAVMYLFVWDIASPFTGDLWDHSMILKDYTAMFTAISMYTYYSKDKNRLMWLSKIGVICVIATSLLTIIVSFFYPEFSRNVLEAEYYADRFTDSQIQNLLFFNRFGSGTRADGFGFMVICILFAFFYKYRKMFSINKWLIITVAFTCFYALVQMAFATLLLYSLFFSIIANIGIKQKVIFFGLVAVALFVILIVPNESWISMFNGLANYFGIDSTLGVRFHEIAEYMKFDEGLGSNGVSNRIDVRYSSALKAFFSSPITGVLSLPKTTYGMLGENHLFLMNKLVLSGLVGFLLWINVLWGFFYDFRKKISKSFYSTFLFASLAIVSYGLIKVIIVRQAWMLLFVILPGINYYIEKRKNILSRDCN